MFFFFFFPLFLFSFDDASAAICYDNWGSGVPEKRRKVIVNRLDCLLFVAVVASNLFFLPFPRFHGAWAAAICTEVLVFLIKEENNGKSLVMHCCYHCTYTY